MNRKSYRAFIPVFTLIIMSLVIVLLSFANDYFDSDKQESCKEQYEDFEKLMHGLGPENATFILTYNNKEVAQIMMSDFILSISSSSEEITSQLEEVIDMLNDLRGEGIPWGGMCKEKDGTESLWDGWIPVDILAIEGNFSEAVQKKIKTALPEYTVEIIVVEEE